MAAANFSLFIFHFSLKNRIFADEMTKTHITNLLLALAALVLTVLCVISIWT